MSQPIGSLSTSALPLPVPTKISDENSEVRPQATSTPSSPVDSITLSQRALDYLHQANPSLNPPAAGASLDEQKQYNSEVNTAEFIIKKIDGIKLNSTYQSYADIINSSESSDTQKLQAYSNYQVDAVLNDTLSVSGYHSTDQDFKFDVLTRNSAFIKSINSGDISTYYRQQAVVRSQDPHGHFDLQKDIANLIDAGSTLTSIQQGVIAINIASVNLMSSIMNRNRTSSINLGLHNTNDVKSAIDQAVDLSFQQLNSSKVGTSTNPANVAYRKMFTQMVQSFGERASSRVESGAPVEV